MTTEHVLCTREVRGGEYPLATILTQSGTWLVLSSGLIVSTLQLWLNGYLSDKAMIPGDYFAHSDVQSMDDGVPIYVVVDGSEPESTP